MQGTLTRRILMQEMRMLVMQEPLAARIQVPKQVLLPLVVQAENIKRNNILILYNNKSPLIGLLLFKEELILVNQSLQHFDI